MCVPEVACAELSHTFKVFVIVINARDKSRPQGRSKKGAEGLYLKGKRSDLLGVVDTRTQSGTYKWTPRTLSCPGVCRVACLSCRVLMRQRSVVIMCAGGSIGPSFQSRAPALLAHDLPLPPTLPSATSTRGPALRLGKTWLLQQAVCGACYRPVTACFLLLTPYSLLTWGLGALGSSFRLTSQCKECTRLLSSS